jgi:magnesium transporter
MGKNNNDVFKHETTGTLMKKGYIALRETYTVDQAIMHIRQNVQGKTNIHYLYIVSADNQLTGVLSIRELLGASSKDSITSIMKKDITSLPTDLDQEDAAQIFRDEDLVTIPVVNAAMQLIGVIHVEDILDVVWREADEDIEKLFASGKEIDFHTNPFTAAYRRLPWLIILLFIGLLSGSIIEGFEATLEAVVALAFFMPMIAGMTGNTGTQSLAVVVRGLVSEKLDMKAASRLIFRELIVGVIIGIVCAIVIAIIAYFWQGSIALGLIVGVSLFATLIIGTIAGTIIPLILHKFKMDPAIASGPLITTINDILSLLIYFGIATKFISELM